MFALNCLLQIELESSEEESSFGDALNWLWLSAEHFSAQLRWFFFASYSPVPLLIYEASPLYSILCNLFTRLFINFNTWHAE